MVRQMKVLREAEIAPGAVQYSVAVTVLVFLCLIFTIPLLPFAVLLSAWYYKRYFKALSVTLTTRELIVRRGIWIRTESTVPLEKVTDVGLVEGPVMRRYNVKGLRVETAGQTGAAGVGLLSIIGIVDPDDFRDAVLDQRDKVSDREDARPASAGSGELRHDGLGDREAIELLREIRNHVSRI